LKQTSGTFSAAPAARASTGLPSGVYDTATLEALTGKKPLIKLSADRQSFWISQSAISSTSICSTIPPATRAFPATASTELLWSR